MTDAGTRPDPDRLLASVRQAEARARRGQLRVFFGASAGVGKTYAMLEAAQAARQAGTDIVVGYVEPHGRAATERLLQGLELIPTLSLRHRGIERRELDLDAALLRHPAVLIVDELAHSNPMDAVPAPRHAKRWQDIEELLEAGISVWTTVNVQHLEGLNDVVAGITGIRQQETVPDRIFDEADQVELIDLPTEELQARLSAGKVYVAEQAGRALENFFRTPNLTALRELALRKTADRVDAAMRDLAARDAHTRPWLARDRLLVALGPDDQAEQLVRAGKRMADGLDAEWTVVFVETPRLLRLSENARNRRIAVLRLAESLGAETVTLDGPGVAAAVLEYAQTRNISRILTGRPKRRGWRAWLRPSAVTQLLGGAGTIDVTVIGQPPRSAVGAQRPAAQPVARKPVRWSRYLWGLGTTLVCTALDWQLFARFELANLAMVYLLGAAISGLNFGRGPAILTCIANVAAFDFFFVPPRFTFAVSDLQYLITFGVMLVVALTLANLMVSVRLQTRIAGHRERRTAALYAMSRELAQTRSAAAMTEIAARHVSAVFDGRAAVLVPGTDAKLEVVTPTVLSGAVADFDLSVAEWVYHRAVPAGLGTDTLAGSRALFLPLSGTQRALGVLAVLPANPRRILLPEQRHLLSTFAGQLALALERAALGEEAERTRVAAETEGLRNSLLTSISHDLRTPLAVIAGASDALLEHPDLPASSRGELARSIHRQAEAMTDLVSNVLDLVRLEAGAVQPRLVEYDFGELLGGVLHRLREALQAHPLHLQVPEDLPVLRGDERLLGQLLGNLLENVARHTPAGTPIDVVAQVQEGELQVGVLDRGPGLPSGDPQRLFDKFQRGQLESSTGGVGLGLAICRAIVQLHGGWIRAADRPGGGARFEFGLPLS